MKEAYSEAGNVIKESYKKRVSFRFPPIVTVVLLVATIVLLVLGWFNFDNIVKGIVAALVAVLAVVGMFQQDFIDAFNRQFNKLLEAYSKLAGWFIAHKITSFSVVAICIALFLWLMSITPSSLVPTEDTGTIMGVVDMPPATSVERTKAVMDQVDSIAGTIPAVYIRNAITGYSFIADQGNNYGSFIIKLKPWEERDNKTENAAAISGLLTQKCSEIKNARIMFFQPPMISGYSVSNGFEIKLQDKTGGDLGNFYKVYQNFIAKLNARPEIAIAYSTFNPAYPQYMVELDVAKIKKAGLTQNTILSTLQAYYGGMYVSNFNKFGKLYRVMMQATPEARVSPETLKQIKVRNGAEMAPIDNFVTLKRVYGPDAINRFNMFTTISVSGNPAPGVSSGQAIKVIKEVAAESLPVGFTYEFSGMTREEDKQSGSSSTMVFGLVFLFVYLLLSAQYESYIIPLSVLFSVPLGLMGTFIFANFMGIDNNIYLQIALIMLIGLLAKNAILIVEFALERRRTGVSIVNSAILGSKARLRPILMTSLAMIIGLLPLMFATGAGANGYRALGTGAIGGMLIGMILQLLVVPALFVVFEIIQEKFKPFKWKDTDNTELSSELEQYTQHN